ncbi:MAG: hypothetical protein Q4D06_05780 [Coriobacteriia bacterium]|nr:hypothetical protein [Coriobacteriia bacterium]
MSRISVAVIAGVVVLAIGAGGFLALRWHADANVKDRDGMVRPGYEDGDPSDSGSAAEGSGNAGESAGDPEPDAAPGSESGAAPDPDPDPDDGRYELLDGDRTYVANDELLARLVGTWVSDDGRWELKVTDKSAAALSLDGARVLRGTVSFVYLLPNPLPSTSLDFEPTTLRRTLAPSMGQIVYASHEADPAGEDDGTVKLTLELADGQRQQVVLAKHP